MAVWKTGGDHAVIYDQPEGHTFSLYIKGGRDALRLDGKPAIGRPHAFSVMPHHHRSEWKITAPATVVHLYLPTNEFSRILADTFERNSRLLDLPEITFADAPHPAAGLRQIARAIANDDTLAAEAAMNDTIALFLADPRWGGLCRRTVTGGLAPSPSRRIVEYVEAHLHGPIRLADLASVAGLSPWHFQRAFRVIGPHWVVRVEC